MAAGVIRNLFAHSKAPVYFPPLFQEAPEQKESEEQVMEEEEEEEDEEECDSLDPFVLNPALDVTSQLLKFADLISSDVQRYFGRCSYEREAGDVCEASASAMTSGRLRYYDDLLRIARAGGPEEQEPADDPGLTGTPKGSSGLGPLAELFNQRSPRAPRGQPMHKRPLPLSFWTEPAPRCSLDGFGSQSDDTSEGAPAGGGGQMFCGSDSQHSSHQEPDFSDLLAYWDPNPEFTHMLS